MGVAQLRPGQPIGELLTVADLAMYQAKESGRNRVHRGDPADLGRIENPKRRAP
jgi:PleD family two-component response regulator